MRKITAFLIGALLCHGAANAALTGAFVPVDTNLNIPANLVFTEGGSVDTYEVKVTNTGDNATSVEMEFTGDFFQIDGAGMAFRDTSGIPNFFGNDFPDSFFVLPGSANVLAAGTVDTAAQLSSSFTLPGDTAILPGGGAMTTIAFLTVPAGGAAPEFVSGRAAIAGAFEDITFEIDPGGDTTAAIRGDIDLGNNMISMQGAFRGNGEELAAVMTMNDGNSADAVISSLVISNDTFNLYGATGVGTDKVDLTIDQAAARQLPPDTFATADLLVETADGTQFNYQLKANVPEPSTVALASLALVGLVGFARRK